MYDWKKRRWQRDGLSFADATRVGTGNDQMRASQELNRGGERIQEFPPHLYTPENAQSIDIRRARVVDPGTTEEILMTFRGIQGASVRFIGYAIYNDGLVEDEYSFLPQVNGKRIFPYHGNPEKNYLISLGLAPDLADYSLIDCNLFLNPGDVLTWKVTNSSLVATAMGVRMKGYIDFSQKQVAQRFGG